MNNQISLTPVTPDNLDACGLFCVKNKKHKGYQAKHKWLSTQLDHGIHLKIAHDPTHKPIAFIEYADSEATVRLVDACNHSVIHCLWSEGRKKGHTGVATQLINDCVKEATKNKKNGVIVITSDGSWMCNRTIFEKAGFRCIDEQAPFQLMYKSIKKSTKPAFSKISDDRLTQYDELTLLYTNQCPYIGKAIVELPPVAKEYGIQLNLKEINDPIEARSSFASPYGVFSLIYQGRLLADHPISRGRFKNILTNELG